MSNLVALLYTAEVSTESCIVFLDINGFLPISNGFAHLLKEHPDEVREKLWRKLDDMIKKTVVRYHPTAIREVGGDSWLITFPNADDAVEWALRINRSVRKELMRIIIGMEWGVPRLTKGGAMDHASIMAYKIVESMRNNKSNQILVTKKVVTRLSDQFLVRLCKFAGNYNVPFLGKACLYKVENINKKCATCKSGRNSPHASNTDSQESVLAIEEVHNT